MVQFEGYERRIKTIEECLKKNNIASLEASQELCLNKGIDVGMIVKGVQNICFDNAVWAYTLGTAIALKNGAKKAVDAAKFIGEGLQAFCVPGTVASNRRIGEGHGKLASMLLAEKTKCFALVVGHESFAAAEGAIGIVSSVNRVRKDSLRIIINGLGKDAAYITSRINGFTYVKTEYDFVKNEINIVEEKPFSSGDRSKVRIYGAHDVLEGIAIMVWEEVDVLITGNTTNPTRFQHLVAGTYKKWALENNRPIFNVASGGGTGRTMHPDNMAAGPASYGLTDSMGRMHSDAQFAGSSSVPEHVNLMGFIGAGNNPIVGMTVATAVAVEEAS